ncbi:hypothetical protein [Paenibacillus sp. 22594]|uniref:hypothetical protein n=1 Tax=Paenibacillus sp. 22594 TaxID=3453947 RepID=UPI003F853734
MRPAKADLAFPQDGKQRLPIPECDKPYRVQVSASAGKLLSMETIRKYPVSVICVTHPGIFRRPRRKMLFLLS